MALKNAYIERYHGMTFEELNVEFLKLEAKIKNIKRQQYILRLIRVGKKAEVSDGRS